MLQQFLKHPCGTEMWEMSTKMQISNWTMKTEERKKDATCSKKKKQAYIYIYIGGQMYDKAEKNFSCDPLHSTLSSILLLVEIYVCICIAGHVYSKIPAY